MMAIFLPHIYPLVKYEVGQRRKNLAVARTLYRLYHYEVSRSALRPCSSAVKGGRRVGHSARGRELQAENACRSGALGLVNPAQRFTDTWPGEARRRRGEAGRVDALGLVQ